MPSETSQHASAGSSAAATPGEEGSGDGSFDTVAEALRLQESVIGMMFLLCKVYWWHRSSV